MEDGVAQSVEHWTANLATRVRSPVGEEPSDLICAFLHVQMESNWAGLSVCNCRHTGKWCGTIKAVGNTDHTRQTWIHMQTPLSPLAGCGPVGEGTSGKVLNWTVRSLNHAYTTTPSLCFFFGPTGKTRWPPWPLIGWDIFDFFSETAERNSTKLDRKQDLNVRYQVCIFRADRKNKIQHVCCASVKKNLLNIFYWSVVL